MGALHDWFNELTPEEQEQLHIAARKSPLGLDRYPMVVEVAQELQAWQLLGLEVMEAHGDWLARTRARFERLGIPWTTTEFERRSWLWEHE